MANSDSERPQCTYFSHGDVKDAGLAFEDISDDWSAATIAQIKGIGNITTMTLPVFRHLLTLYPSTRDRVALKKTKPSSNQTSLADLDDARYSNLPETLKSRQPDAYLTKPELTTLLHWKLAHGTFRPSLPGLIAQNRDEDVERVTREAFSLYQNDKSAIQDTIKLLSSLRGVGPATASLLLSVASPEEIPFFSDELFRWCMSSQPPSPGSTTHVPTDWKRPIKYNMKEYLEVVRQVKDLRDRLANGVEDDEKKITATQCEMVAYVLGNAPLPKMDQRKVRVVTDADPRKTKTPAVSEQLNDAAERTMVKVSAQSAQSSKPATKRKSLSPPAIKETSSTRSNPPRAKRPRA